MHEDGDLSSLWSGVSRCICDQRRFSRGDPQRTGLDNIDLSYFVFFPVCSKPNGKINTAFHLLGGLMKLQKLGGYSVFAMIVVGSITLTFRTLPLSDLNDPAKVMAAVAAAPAQFYAFNLLWVADYILFLIAIIALHERMQANAPYLTRTMLISMSACTVVAITESLPYKHFYLEGKRKSWRNQQRKAAK
jgi:hypothetical protein